MSVQLGYFGVRLERERERKLQRLAGGQITKMNNTRYVDGSLSAELKNRERAVK